MKTRSTASHSRPRRLALAALLGAGLLATLSGGTSSIRVAAASASSGAAPARLAEINVHSLQPRHVILHISVTDRHAKFRGTRLC